MNQTITQQEGKQFLYRQLVRLGEMMGDGLHLEPDGKWISKEYKRILVALGYFPKSKRDISGINEAVAKRLADLKCPSCDGDLQQTKSGSLRAVCNSCGSKYQVLKRSKSLCK